MKKAMVAPLVFIFGSFAVLGRKENYLTNLSGSGNFLKTPARYTVKV